MLQNYNSSSADPALEESEKKEREFLEFSNSINSLKVSAVDTQEKVANSNPNSTSNNELLITTGIRQTQQNLERLEKENFGLKMKLHLLGGIHGWGGGGENDNGERVLNEMVLMQEKNQSLTAKLNESRTYTQALLQDLEYLQDIQAQTEMELQECQMREIELQREIMDARRENENDYSMMEGGGPPVEESDLENLFKTPGKSEVRASSITTEEKNPFKIMESRQLSEQQTQTDDLDEFNDPVDIMETSDQEIEAIKIQEMREEFNAIAQEAAVEITNLHARLREQEVQLLAFQEKLQEREEYGLREFNDAQTETEIIDEQHKQHAHSQSFSGFSSNSIILPPSAVSVLCQTSTSIVHEIGLQCDILPPILRQSASPKVIMMNKTTSTASDEMANKAVSTVTATASSTTATQNEEATISASEYLANKQRYIQELKERNLLLVRISQHLDACLGMKLDSKSVTSFSMLKQSLFEKLKAIGNWNQTKEDLQKQVSILTSQLQEYEANGQVSKLHELVLQSKKQIIKDRELANSRISDLLQIKKKLELDLTNSHRKLALIKQSQPTDSDILQKQYISAISESQELKTQLSHALFKIRFSVAHIEKFMTVPEQFVYLEEALRSLKS